MITHSLTANGWAALAAVRDGRDLSAFHGRTLHVLDQKGMINRDRAPPFITTEGREALAQFESAQRASGVDISRALADQDCR